MVSDILQMPRCARPEVIPGIPVLLQMSLLIDIARHLAF